MENGYPAGRPSPRFCLQAPQTLAILLHYPARHEYPLSSMDAPPMAEHFVSVFRQYPEAYRLPQLLRAGYRVVGGEEVDLTRCVTDLSLLGSQAERALDQIIVRIR
ncbi:hypothetical protein B0H14DRAFT_2603939 [Mycena olivaceomarginata]|nr:hypothetical protein B0H14DRAFT_2603939 [Mycena olivaceomarginata]